jgi:hypothetical protein
MILPIGTEDFGKIIHRKLYFVDKSLFIKEILDDHGTEILVTTRPRRFGKTLNLSMLHYFRAEKVNKNSTQGLFEHLKIAKSGDTYLQHQGKYPVIFVTFKDIKELSYENTFKNLSRLMSRVYQEHIDLLKSDKLYSHQKNIFQSILEERADETHIKSALLDLTQYLYLHYETKPWLLIDEYDTPIQSGYINGYYEKIIDFMRGIFSSVLKTNPYLEKAVITGILRVAKESLFSGVNNLEVYSLLRDEYSEHFGFTEVEVDAMLKKSHLLRKSEEVKEWYNGYKIGKNIIYNPWSIVNCIKQNGETKPYWVNTSDNQLIKDLLKESTLKFKHQFELLISGESIEELIDERMVFQYLKNNPSSVWNLLLMAGYLKPVSSRETYQGTLTKLAIPNREVRDLYRQMIEQWLSNGYGLTWYNEFIASLLDGNMEEFKKHLSKVILQITSYHDFAKEPEAFYQGLMLGFTVSLHSAGTHEIKSNRESGLGRFDIIIIPKDISKPGIVIELKAHSKKENLGKLAKIALKQIDEKKYTEMLSNKGVKEALKIGIGFFGKNFEICSSREIF